MTVLKDIVLIFGLSTIVNFLFTKIRVPTIIGYMLTGIITGPHLLGLIESGHEIELIAEIGVILLMFTIGLEFSLNHLLKIRKIVFLGGFVQFTLTAFAIMAIAISFQIEWKGSLFFGFLTSLSSTAIVLKILQERSELTSNYGRTVLGILIFQDLILIPLLLFTPILAGQAAHDSHFMVLMLKTILIFAFVLAGNKWFMPKILRLVALTKNSELFLMSILLICLSIAFITSKLGLSLAFGAFLAGLMISESEYSHNAFGHLIPFKDTFSSFFFVSIGMMLDLNFVSTHFLFIIELVVIVILIKSFIAGGTSFILGHTFMGTIMVGIALSQVGEFSFILAKMGLTYNLIPEFYFQMFIAVSITTMSLSPFLIPVSKRFAQFLLKFPLPKVVIEGLFPLPQIDIPKFENHLVFIGKDTRALNLSKMAKYLNLPYISIVFDPAIARERQKTGENIIYGDAVNEPILLKAFADKAKVIVISVGNLITSMAIIEKVKSLNKKAYIILRTKNIEDIEELYKLGADEVIPEEFETAIELFGRILKKLLVPRRKINNTIAKIRDDHYGIFRENKPKGESILDELPNIEINAVKIDDNAFVIEKSLLDLKFRVTYGATVVAILRGTELIEHPDSNSIFQKGDIVYLIGKPGQLEKAIDLFGKKEIKKIA